MSGLRTRSQSKFSGCLQIPAVHQRLDERKTGKHKTAQLVITVLCHSRNKLLEPHRPKPNYAARHNATMQAERRSNLLKPLIAHFSFLGGLSYANLAKPPQRSVTSAMGRSARFRIRCQSARRTKQVSFRQCAREPPSAKPIYLRNSTGSLRAKLCRSLRISHACPKARIRVPTQTAALAVSADTPVSQAHLVRSRLRFRMADRPRRPDYPD